MPFHFFGKMSLPQTVYFSISNFVYKLTQPIIYAHNDTGVLQGDFVPYTKKFWCVGFFVILYRTLIKLCNPAKFYFYFSYSMTITLYNGRKGLENFIFYENTIAARALWPSSTIILTYATPPPPLSVPLTFQYVD